MRTNEEMEKLLDKNDDFRIDDVIDLYNWSANYGYGSPTNPWPVFMFLTGYTEAEFGEQEDIKGKRLDFVGLDKLGSAIRNYSEHPGLVYELITDLIAYEGGNLKDEGEN
jgi:hypothetical protein